MRKIFKWPGGKSRELKRIKEYLHPDVVSGKLRLVEPFCGSAALTFSLEAKNAWLNDLDDQVMNFYRVLSTSEWENLHENIDKVCALPFMLRDHPDRETTHTLEDEYYDARARDFVPGLQSATDFYVRRQLCFSGMIRVSPRTGKSNVPFGWYKELKNNVSPKAHELVKNWKLSQLSYEEMDIQPDDFVFLDPPYLGRAGYFTPDWTEDDHNHFIDWVLSLPCKWLLVHTQDSHYDKLINDPRTKKCVVGSHTYSQNFVGRKSNTNKVEHIYAFNY